MGGHDRVPASRRRAARSARRSRRLWRCAAGRRSRPLVAARNAGVSVRADAAVPDRRQAGLDLVARTWDPVHGRHALALRVEGQLGDAREGPVEVVLDDARLGGRQDQRALGRVADRVVRIRVVVVPLQDGVIAQRAGDQQQVECRLDIVSVVRSSAAQVEARQRRVAARSSAADWRCPAP